MWWSIESRVSRPLPSSSSPSTFQRPGPTAAPTGALVRPPPLRPTGVAQLCSRALRSSALLHALPCSRLPFALLYASIRRHVRSEKALAFRSFFVTRACRCSVPGVPTASSPAPAVTPIAHRTPRPLCPPPSQHLGSGVALVVRPRQGHPPPIAPTADPLPLPVLPLPTAAIR